MYPRTPGVPFPISLNHRDDPFSRAVSPIHGDLDIDFPHGSLFNGHTGTGDDNTTISQTAMETDERGATSQDVEMGQGQIHENPFSFVPGFAKAIDNVNLNNAFISDPPSPRQVDPTSNDWAALRTAAALNRPSSADPRAQLHSHNQASPSGEMQQIQSPGFIALNKIRKPSLRTLMSTRGSQGPSPAQSPTLFDQPMQMDEEVEVGPEGG